MTPEAWQRIVALFEDAVDLPPGEQSAFLAQACGDDAALRGEVEALLGADGRAHTVLERGAAAALDAPPRRVGPFRVVRPLGAGGMGSVYLGERDDDQFEQRVALKLVRPGLYSEDVQRRFEAERRILARLEHPGIARLFDGGVLPDGRPWLAMEVVDGATFDEHCRGLPLRQRLRLFQDVCAAVHYAHGRLVVHRDLKPDNILVTAAGEVKLLDFGIAKVLEEEADGLTRTGTRAMTPGYAAPEQVRGEAVTTATDVYALGLILFEIVTGRPPFDFGGMSQAELERVICATAPPRPSSLAPGLSRDLDAICARALRKEPEARYASVDQLRDDVGRLLRDEPVRARRGTWRYRAGKFVRRHVAGLGAAAAVVALVAMLVGVYTARLARARDRAAAQAQKADEVAAFLIELFTSVDPDRSRGVHVSARDLLELGRRRVESEALAPAIKADLELVMGKVHASLGLYDDAATLLESALRHEEALHGADRPGAARVLYALGDIRREQARFDEAEPLLRRALEIRRRTLPPDDEEIAESLDGCGALETDRGHPDAATRLHQEALALRRRRDPRSAAVGDSLANLAMDDRDRGDYAAAAAGFRAALAIHRATLGHDAPATVNDVFDLGDALRKQGQYVEAEGLYRQALAAREKIYGEDHPDTANSVNHLARLLFQRSRYDEAIPLFERAIAINRRLYGSSHAAVAASLGGLAGVYLAQGKPELAEPLYQEAREIVTRVMGEDHPYTAAVMNSLAAVAWAKGEHEEAIRRYRDALARARRVLPAGHVDIARSLLGLGVALRDTGDPAAAEPYLAEAHALRAAALPPSSPDVALADLEWGACLRQLGRGAEAQRRLLEARAALLALVPVALEPKAIGRVDHELAALWSARSR